MLQDTSANHYINIIRPHNFYWKTKVYTMAIENTAELRKMLTYVTKTTAEAIVSL